MKKYLYEVRPNRPVMNKEGRTTRCPFSDLLTKEDVMGYMKSANIWRRFPDGVVRVTGQNLDLLHREKMNSLIVPEEIPTNSEVKVTVVEPKEEEIAEATKGVIEEVETENPVVESNEEKTIHEEITDITPNSSEVNDQIDENTGDSEVDEIKNDVIEESTKVYTEEPKKEHQNVVINTGNQNRNIQVNSKNNKNHKR